MEQDEWEEDKQWELEKAGTAVEFSILALICSRLAKITGSTTYAEAARMVIEDNGKIQSMLNVAYARLVKLTSGIFDEMADMNDKWAEPFYRYRKIEQPKSKDDPFLGKILGDGKGSADFSTRQYCRTSVLRIQAPDGTYKRIDEAYRQIVDEAILRFGNAEVDYNRAITDAVRKLTQTGLRVQYESGATRELYAAVSMNVMDGYRRTMQDIRDQQSQQFGSDGVEVSAHSMCAPDHQPYQGKRFSNRKWEQIQSGLARPIGEGKNCRHMVTGIILGVSSKAYDEDQLKEMREKSNRKTGVKTKSGNDMTAYEFSQWQRRQETSIRKLKLESRLLDKAGQDGSKLSAKADALTKRYVDMSKLAKVETRLERTQVYEWKL